jgi:hypothetical protein
MRDTAEPFKNGIQYEEEIPLAVPRCTSPLMSLSLPNICVTASLEWWLCRDSASHEAGDQADIRRSPESTTLSGIILRVSSLISSKVLHLLKIAFPYSLSSESKT